ncbi:MAG: hypothetical protein J6Y71_05025 [Ruminococcus sp.]|nr:hypothetical protein [Ruminococcus sp.]
MKKVIGIILCAIISCLCLISCNEKSKTNDYKLTDIAEIGNYVNELSENKETIVINSDDTLVMSDFDSKALFDFYSQSLNDLSISEEDFAEKISSPMNITVKKGDIDGTYKLLVSIIQNDNDGSGWGMTMTYNEQDKSIYFKKNTYSLKSGD